MILDRIKKLYTRKEIDAFIIQFMAKSDYFEDRSYTYCGNVKHLIKDWHGECNNCPENDAMLLMVTLYRQGIAHPIEQIGLDENITFETLMRTLEE